MRRTALAGLIALLGSTGTQAGIAFTPHLSEYASESPGHYHELSLSASRIGDVFDRDGRRTTLGAPLLPSGAHTDLALLTHRWLVVGNPLRELGLGLFEHRDQFCRVITSLGWQQGNRDVVQRSRSFGLDSGGAGLGDVFVLCGVYGLDHRLGPLKFNGLFSTAAKLPVGQYERDSLLNIGTRYRSTIPQLGLHAELYGRLFVDASLAWQFNGRNDRPAYGGLTPSRPADVRNAEINLGWKFNERWYADLGYSLRWTVGANVYDDLDISTRDPVPAQQACDLLQLGPSACAATSLFFLDARRGRYRDRGVESQMLTTGLYYVYRNSAVWSLRALLPVDGRGGQLDVPFDLFLAVPDLSNPGQFGRAPLPLTTTSTPLNGVQEAAASPASPVIELRVVFLFWAP